jgi:hypothetical protein
MVFTKISGCMKAKSSMGEIGMRPVQKCEPTREKLERAFGKSGNPRGHNVDDILNALEAKGWDIRNRQEEKLVNTLAKCETIEPLMYSCEFDPVGQTLGSPRKGPRHRRARRQ